MEDGEHVFGLEDKRLKELEDNARDMCNIISDCNYESALACVKTYSCIESSTERIQKVLDDYFTELSNNVPYATLYSEASSIQRIFPLLSKTTIIPLLQEFAYEEHRVGIVVRSLLRGNKELKRTSSQSFLHVNSANKRIKLSSTKPSATATSSSSVNLTPNNEVDDSPVHFPNHNNNYLNDATSSSHNSDKTSLNCVTIKAEPVDDITLWPLIFPVTERAEEKIEPNMTPFPIKEEPVIKIEPDEYNAAHMLHAPLNEGHEVDITLIVAEFSVKDEPDIKIEPDEYNTPVVLHVPVEESKVKMEPDEYNAVVGDQPESLEMDSQATIIAPPENIDDHYSFDNEQSPEILIRAMSEKLEHLLENNRFGIDDVQMLDRSTIVIPNDTLEPQQDDTIAQAVSDKRTNESPVIVNSVTNIYQYNVASCSTLNNEQTPIKIKFVRSASQAAAGSSTSVSQNNEKYDLWEHLTEMFTSIPREYIMKLCKKYNVDRYAKPPDPVFNVLVCKLLAFDPENERFNNREKSKEPKARDMRKSKRNRVYASGMPSTSQAHSRISKTNIAHNRSSLPITRERLIQIPPVEQEFNHLKSIDKNTNVTSGTDEYLGEILNDLRDAAVNEGLDYEDENDPYQEIDDVADEGNVQAPIEEIADSLIPLDEYDEDEESKSDQEQLIYPLMEMFPQACPMYIRTLCKNKRNDPGILDGLISEILDFDYPRRKKAPSPKRTISVEEQLAIFREVLPDADPNFLRMNCERLENQQDELSAFINNLIQTRKYPTMKDYLRKQQLSAQQKQYTTDFSVQKFLEVIPDPVSYFSAKNKKAPTVDMDSFHYALCFLRNRYPRIQLTKIRAVFKNNNSNLLKTCKELDKINSAPCMRCKRPLTRMPELIQDIPLLQEIAYLEHHQEIMEHIQERQLSDMQERENAREHNLFQTCTCCYDDEVLLKDIYSCEGGCIFCKACVKKGTEVAYGDGKLDFLCLGNCPSHFSLQTLQAVLEPKMFSIIALKKQVEEVKSAGIEDLELCPFCDFATIPARDDKLFRCMNPECMKESCRLCKEPSHVPLRCDEVEKEDDVRARTYIENKMTEALLRKCYKCGLKFIKAEGCNKMTCSCGAMMCYVCGQPVKDYKHFNGNGGDQFELCPLYSDTNKLHEEAVLLGASKAKQEVGIDPTKLKFDPTVDIQQHYKEQAAQNPGGPAMPIYVNQYFNAHEGAHAFINGRPVVDPIRIVDPIHIIDPIRVENFMQHFDAPMAIRMVHRQPQRPNNNGLQPPGYQPHPHNHHHPHGRYHHH